MIIVAIIVAVIIIIILILLYLRWDYLISKDIEILQYIKYISIIERLKKNKND